MAMTLRLTQEESDALREYADSTGRSMQDVAREAIRDFIWHKTQTRADLLKRIVAEDAEALDLLAQ